jgi:hypothetical protein
MYHEYRVFLEETRTCRATDIPRRKDIEALVSQRPSLQLPEHSGVVISRSEPDIHWFLSAARELGCRCLLNVTTFYEIADVLNAPFGIFQGGVNTQPAGFRAVLPTDAFDFTGACGTCGLGARQVKPHVLSQSSLRCKPGCYSADLSPSVLIPTPTARQIIEATGQPECMRHPTTRAGELVREYMEPVPSATMPPLSRELCKGISFGSTDAVGDAGEPPKVAPPCPECGRETWDFDRSQHSRLVYAREAADHLRSRAVVEMNEPWAVFPDFDVKQRTFKWPASLPRILFNADALKLLIDHAVSENPKDTIVITPVHIE